SGCRVGERARGRHRGNPAQRSRSAALFAGQCCRQSGTVRGGEGHGEAADTGEAITVIGWSALTAAIGGRGVGKEDGKLTGISKLSAVGSRSRISQRRGGER